MRTQRRKIRLAENNGKERPELDIPAVIADRREGLDRRRDHLKAFAYQFVNPRRRNRQRRESDLHPFHVDFHEPTLLLVVLITLSLCVVDIYATLILLTRGGRELNPFMRHLINIDVWLFFIIKYSLTAACLFVLLSYRRFTFFRGLSGLHSLYGVLAIYTMLAIYQVGLLASALG